MEKCTYCVQRINEAKIQSEKEGRTIHDGEIRTACQQTCPIGCDRLRRSERPEQPRREAAGEARNYALLAELNTRPRTTYLGALRNVEPGVWARS